MDKSRIIVVGIGPGAREDMTSAVLEAVRHCDVLIGYRAYFQYIEQLLSSETRCIDTGMKRECERAEEAFNQAEQGKNVCVISSGDAGIYGMASLILEMKHQRHSPVEVEVLPGISAFQKAAALLGAPTGHDFCVISLSDLMTPWTLIEKRLIAAAEADFVTSLYNPKSESRYWQLYRAKEIFLKRKQPQTPVGIVKQAGREGQCSTITTLLDFDPEQADMQTVIIIGNSQSYLSNGKFITPRGYYRNSENSGQGGIGQSIMLESFLTIEKELKDRDIPLDRKWALLHAIHTTADFEMENILWMDDLAVKKLHQQLCHDVKTIVTDVTMVAAGIRKGALNRLGINVKCFLTDERAVELAAGKGITRTQAGIRTAVEEYPNALYVFGNAPTALMELCALIRNGKANPCGIIAAPVGFVHVCESKQMVKVFTHIPKIIVEGRKGGSNIAATLTNAILCFDDAEQLRPGRDL